LKDPSCALKQMCIVVSGGESLETYEHWSSECCDTFSRYSDLIEVVILSYHKQEIVCPIGEISKLKRTV
jgi:hypothetical protein